MKKYVLTAICLMFALRIYSQATLHDWDGQIARAAALITTDPEAAEDAFEELLKGKNKKNVALLVDIGRAYLKEGGCRFTKKRDTFASTHTTMVPVPKDDDDHKGSWGGSSSTFSSGGRSFGGGGGKF